MYSIDNISIREYFQLEDTSIYDLFIEVLNPSNRFAGKVLNTSKLTFNEVEVIKGIFGAPTFEDIKDLFILLWELRGDISTSPDEQFLDASVFDLFRAKTHLQEFIKGVIKKEQDWLTSTPDDKMLMINAQNRVAPFSVQLTKMNIAERYGYRPKEIGLWKYTDVFNILVASKVTADLQREYSEIK